MTAALAFEGDSSLAAPLLRLAERVLSTVARGPRSGHPAIMERERASERFACWLKLVLLWNVSNALGGAHRVFDHRVYQDG